MYADLTDASHNVKNVHYQLKVGGTSVKVIGVIVIGTEILYTSDIDQDICRLKGFSSEFIALQLASADFYLKY